MTVVVRDAREADLPSITELFNALIPSTAIAWRDHLADELEMGTWWQEQVVAGHPVLVADDDGAVVGYTTWTGFRGGPRFPGYRHTKELTIHVAGDQHRRGIGRILMEALVARAAIEGIHVLVAAVDGDNARSVDFHRSLGFIETARMPEVGRKFDQWQTLVLLQRIIEH
jgi:phosphinothricin acetyltransferase